MTTLATMRTRIGSELRRPTMTAQIDAAIQTAIVAYQGERFLFNETREFYFGTEEGQPFYSSVLPGDGLLLLEDGGGILLDGDGSTLELANLLKIDYVQLIIGDQPYTLDPIAPDEIERLSANGTATGQPLGYCWYGEQLRLYPVPNDVWNVRIGGMIQIAGPATDDEADNPWMTKAENLIRCRAKYELYTHVLLNPEAATFFDPDADGTPTRKAFLALRKRTNQLSQQGGWAIRPTSF